MFLKYTQFVNIHWVIMLLETLSTLVFLIISFWLASKNRKMLAIIVWILGLFPIGLMLRTALISATKAGVHIPLSALIVLGFIVFLIEVVTSVSIGGIRNGD